MNSIVLSPWIWSVMIVVAVIIDFIFGDPSFLYHPIILIGNLIRKLRELLNKGEHRRVKGLLLWILSVSIVLMVVCFLEWTVSCFNTWLYIILTTWFLSTMLAEKSLFLAGKKCQDALEAGDIVKARKYTGEIVGRETSQLNEPEIIRAVVETEAENGIDGILAPLFYMFLGVFLQYLTPFLNPLTLAFLYKTVNTLDSMVGYIYEPYKDFGYFSAKIDDWFNFIPARLGSLFIIMAGGICGYSVKKGMYIFLRDRLNHLSPNSAHAEAVIAGLLEIQLGGSNTYFGLKTDKPTIGDKKRMIKLEDIETTMKIIKISEALFIIFYFIIFALISIFISKN